MRSHFLIPLMLLTCTVAAGQLPPSVHLIAPKSTCHGPSQRPLNCDVIYDGELDQMRTFTFDDGSANFNSGRRQNRPLLDGLTADDFITARAGRITDVYSYSYVNGNGVPADGVRIYLWGSGKTPSDKPTVVLEVPPEEVELRWFTDPFFSLYVEIHVAGLNIPYEAGQNWITIQPRDETRDGAYYYVLRNSRRPLQGAEAFVKDGPNGEGLYGFTDWRPISAIGGDAADSYIRLEGCFDPMTIAVEGECGGAAQFSWSNAPPESTLTFLYARQTGNVRIPPNLPCGGTQLGLGQRLLQVAFSVQTGEGSGATERFLPAAACPGYFQAIIRAATGPCEVSNVVAMP